MGRIVPTRQGSSAESIPEWLKPEEVTRVAKKEQGIRKRAREEAPTSKASFEDVVVKFACNSCERTYFPDNGEIQKQARSADKAGKKFTPSCPSCGGSLRVASKTMRKVASKGSTSSHRAATYDVRNVDLRGKEANPYLIPDYAPNTIIDRTLIHKAMNELDKKAREAGMVDTHIRFQRSSHAPNKAHPDAIRSAEYLIDYLDKAGTRTSVTAEVAITPQGKIALPQTFKTSTGEEYMFTKEAVEYLAEGRQFERMMPDMYQKSNELELRPEDPTRFRNLWADDERMKKQGGDAHIMIDHEGESAEVTVHDEGGFSMSTGTPEMGEEIPEEDLFGYEEEDGVEELAEGELEDVEEYDEDEAVEEVVARTYRPLRSGKRGPRTFRVKEGMDLNMLMPGDKLYDQESDSTFEVVEQQPEGVSVQSADQMGMDQEPMFIPNDQTQNFQKVLSALAAIQALAEFDTRDEGTNIPTLDEDEVEIGMTDFPDYTVPVDEAMEELLEDRPDWSNRGRMPMRHLRVMDWEQGGQVKRVKGDPKVPEKVDAPEEDSDRMEFGE